MNARALLVLPRSLLHGAFFFKENGGRALVQKTRYNKTSFVAEKLKFTFCLDNEQYSVLKMGI